MCHFGNSKTIEEKKTQINSFQGFGVIKGTDQEGAQRNFWSDGNVILLLPLVYAFIKTHQTLH
jgi:hypothetical protein